MVALGRLAIARTQAMDGVARTLTYTPKIAETGQAPTSARLGCCSAPLPRYPSCVSVVLPDEVGSMLRADKRPPPGRLVGGLHPGQRADGPS